MSWSSGDLLKKVEKVHDFVLNKLFPELLTKLNNDIAGVGNDNDNGNGSSSDTGDKQTMAMLMAVVPTLVDKQAMSLMTVSPAIPRIVMTTI